MEEEKKRKFPRSFKIALISLGVVLVLYTVLGFFAVPYALRKVLTEKVPEAIHRKLTVGEIKFNPYTLELRLRGLEVDEVEGDGPFVSLAGLYVNLSASSIFNRALVVSETRLEGPFASIVLGRDERFNFSDILEGEKGEEKREEDSKPFRFSVSNIQVLGGEIRFKDAPRGVGHHVKDLALSVPFVSNFPVDTEVFVKPSFSAVVNGTSISLAGKTKPFSESQSTAISVELSDMDLTRYLAYLPASLNFDVKKGFLSLRLGLDYSQEKNDERSLTLKGSASLKDVAIDDAKGRELLRLAAASFELAPSRVTERELILAGVSFEEPRVKLIRQKDSTLNVSELVSEKKGDAKPKEPGARRGDFLVNVREAKVKAGRVDFLDYSAASTPRNPKVVEKEKPFHLPLEDINLKVEELSTKKGSKARVSVGLGVPEKGSLALKGDVGLDPVSASLALDLKGLSVKQFEPYLNEFLNLMITKGELTIAGDVSVSQAEGEEPGTRFKGMVALNGFSSIDPVKAEEFLRWQSLYAQEMDVALSPLKVDIGRVALTDFFSRLIITKDGTFNLKEIIKKPEEDETKPKEPPAGEESKKEEAGSRAVRIDTVSLQGGEIKFSDNYIKPNYSARLTEVAGRVSGLDSSKDRRADVSLMGRLNDAAPLEISGQINPLAEDLFVDLKVRFTDIDLSPLTPYSSKYIGYTIAKGKLNMELKYLIAGEELDAENRILFDQFTLGRTVESPDALKLPVSLAISLLKDREGKIKLDLPVSGDLSDPKFSLGGIIAKVIMNLLAKALTSPFALVGALVGGGGEELSYLEFDHGSSGIDPGDAQKLDKVVKILFERPELKLTISGYVDREKDREGLRRLRFMRKLKAKKLKDMVLYGKKPVPVDEVEIEEEEFDKYLAKAYEDEDFPKPRNAIGIAKKLPPEEMKKLMLTHIEVTDHDLRNLAQQRAIAAREYILKTEKVEAKRIFLKEPDSVFAGEKDGLSGARVEFGLK